MADEEPGTPHRKDDPPGGKLLVPVLIGLVSVTVAVLAWRSGQLNENATDADRAALADSAFVRQAQLEARVFASTLEGVDVQIQVLAAEARALRDAAATGASGAAEDLARAQELEAETEQLLALANRPLSDESLGSPFDTDEIAENFLTSNRELGRHDADADVVAGDELRDHSVKLAGLTAVLAFAVVLLTGAQVSRRRGLDIALMLGAVVLWTASVGAALGLGLS